jgi:hypothetical protein
VRENKLTIQINKPVEDIWDFTTNPKNTPKWINVIQEETSEWPIKAGTVYRNQGKDGKWNTFTMTELEQYKYFVMLGSDNNYHCKYTFRDLGDGKSELEYYEWMENGELEEPFTLDILEKLKSVVES